MTQLSQQEADLVGRQTGQRKDNDLIADALLHDISQIDIFHFGREEYILLF
jgi:hypothetical protein